jgi:hypothetical protein
VPCSSEPFFYILNNLDEPQAKVALPLLFFLQGEWLLTVGSIQRLGGSALASMPRGSIT